MKTKNDQRLKVNYQRLINVGKKKYSTTEVIMQTLD